MSRVRMGKKMSGLFLFVVCMALCMVQTVIAAGTGSTLTLECRKAGEFHIYQVMTGNADGLKATKDFENFPTEITKDNLGEELAKELEIWIKKKNVRPKKSIVVGDGGSAVFEDLENGLYLIDGSSKGEYVLNPFVVLISGEDVKAEGKYILNGPGKPEDPTDPTRPTEPDEGEDPTRPTDPADPTKPADPTDPTDPTRPSGSDDSNGSDNPGNPGTSDNPGGSNGSDGPSGSGHSGSSGGSGGGKSSSQTPESDLPHSEITNHEMEPTGKETVEAAVPTLPQTGQLWWPVFLLGGMGAILFSLGIGSMRRRTGGHEE